MEKNLIAVATGVECEGTYIPKVALSSVTHKKSCSGGNYESLCENSWDCAGRGGFTAVFGKRLHFISVGFNRSGRCNRIDGNGHGIRNIGRRYEYTGCNVDVYGF